MTVRPVQGHAGMHTVLSYAASIAQGVRHPHKFHTGAEPEERCEPMPGDSRIETPDWTNDLAIDIAASVPEVWPSIAKITDGHVVELSPPHRLVLESRRNPWTGREVTSGAYLHTTSAFVIEENSSGSSRVRVRIRAKFVGTPVAKLAQRLFARGDAVHERQVLESIRVRAEPANPTNPLAP